MTGEWAAAVEETVLEEQLQLFSSEQACAEALFTAKWPAGFRCARCGNSHAYKITSRRLPLFQCCSCHYQESLIAGTIMEGSRSELRTWFHALILISFSDSGINAVQLSKEIGVTYKTAWLILHKVRHAMSNADASTMLSGIVRVNSALYGRPHNSTLNRHTREQPLLVGASLNEAGEPVYVKIKKVNEEHLLERVVRPAGNRHFIERHVEHETEDIDCVTARYSSRRFHRLLTTAKKAGQWINAVYSGIGPKHLQAYLNEYCCRLNLAVRGVSLFHYLTRLCAATAPITYMFLLRFPTVS